MVKCVRCKTILTRQRALIQVFGIANKYESFWKNIWSYFKDVEHVYSSAKNWNYKNFSILRCNKNLKYKPVYRTMCSRIMRAEDHFEQIVYIFSLIFQKGRNTFW